MGHSPRRAGPGTTEKTKLLSLAWRLAATSPATLVLVQPWNYFALACILRRWVSGGAYAVTMDHYTYGARPGKLNRIKEELRYRLLLRNASLILADTPMCYRGAKRHLKRPQILLVPPGLWHAHLVEVESGWDAAPCQPTREPIVLFTGRIVRRKNLHDLVRAFALLSADFPEWTLELRGPVADRTYLSELTQLISTSGLETRISLSPPLVGEELYARYRSSSIYALPSTGEGFPTTILEAMYFGGAIVAARTGGVPEQLAGGECGMLHDSGDVTGLVKRLRALMESATLREDYTARARQRVVDLYTWERNLPMVESALRKLLPGAQQSKSPPQDPGSTFGAFRLTQAMSLLLLPVLRLAKLRRLLGARQTISFALKWACRTPKIAFRVDGVQQPLICRRIMSDVHVIWQVFGLRKCDVPMVRQPSVIVDCGAYAGYTTAYFANRYPDAEIYALEPDAGNYRMLCDNCSSYPNVHPIQAAVWGQAGTVVIENPEAAPWSFRVAGERGQRGPRVRALTMEEIWTTSGSTHIDLLKLDIEGAERELFSAENAGWIANVGTIMVELHDRVAPGATEAVETAGHDSGFDLSYVDESVVLSRTTAHRC